MDSAKLKAFADELKKIRKEQNITLQQIKVRTRIDLTYLEAIEDGNFDVMPQVYMRAFIREYAESIGLNAKETLSKYDLAREGKLVSAAEIPQQDEPAVEETPQFNDSTTETPVPMSSTSTVNQPWFVPAVAAVSVVILGLIIYFAFFNQNDDLIVKEKPYEEIIEQSKQRFEVIEQEESKATESKKLNTLKIVAIDTSWVQVTIDADSTTDFILYPERSKTFTGNNDFDLVIGNSAGVKLIFNNKNLELQGGVKKVKHVLVNKDGIKYLPIEKKAD